MIPFEVFHGLLDYDHESMEWSIQKVGGGTRSNSPESQSSSAGIHVPLLMNDCKSTEQDAGSWGTDCYISQQPNW